MVRGYKNLGSTQPARIQPSWFDAIQPWLYANDDDDDDDDDDGDDDDESGAYVVFFSCFMFMY